ncbi:MAG: MBL fold metallo-hydrolase [Chloroflexi bacterium]|nr:MBL fold metallo-hydrolase [Chloroflexota bacterium]
MLKLRIVQAEYGDCFILEFGTPSQPRYILIDGGPASIYERYLREELQSIQVGGGKLDLAILSHVDNDHAIGLLDLFAELRNQRANGLPETIAIDALWHNAFRHALGDNIAIRLKMLLAMAGVAAQAMTTTGMVVQGISEGQHLRQSAAALGIPVNPGFAHDLICVDDAPQPLILDNLTLRIVGPTQKNLEDLKKEWLAWLDIYEESIASGDPFLAAMADRSIPNLSSIMILAEADGKTILFTGDGRGDHLLQGLRQAHLLDAKGRLHVNVLKLPHHGSNRNVSKTFFKNVTADQYVISANGMYGNPDLATLIWIVETAKKQKRTIEIVATNETPSTEKLVWEYDPDKYGYRLRVMKKGMRSMALELAL